MAMLLLLKLIRDRLFKVKLAFVYLLNCLWFDQLAIITALQETLEKIPTCLQVFVLNHTGTKRRSLFLNNPSLFRTPFFKLGFLSIHKFSTSYKHTIKRVVGYPCFTFTSCLHWVSLFFFVMKHGERLGRVGICRWTTHLCNW